MSSWQMLTPRQNLFFFGTKWILRRSLNELDTGEPVPQGLNGQVHLNLGF
jgi:hypothetical protein